jgi:hypothetical protein
MIFKCHGCENSIIGVFQSYPFNGTRPLVRHHRNAVGIMPFSPEAGLNLRLLWNQNVAKARPMRPISWYSNRLWRMSAAEVLARVSDLLATTAQRAGYLTANRPPAPRIQQVPAWISGLTAQNVNHYERAADDVLSNKIRFFGLSSSASLTDLDWNRNPLTGTKVDLHFGPSMDVGTWDVVGDIKYLWEPNRHLDLVALAQAYRWTGNHEYLDGLRNRLCSWFVQCPYLRGPNWNSGLELAVRVINWSAAWQYIGGKDSPMFRGAEGQRFLRNWLDSIFQHVHFIRGRYSRFSSANNHLIGEAAGVFIAGCTWPFWREVRGWRKEAYEVLIRESAAQTTPDGVDREQSVSYQRFVLEFLILSVLAGRAAGVQFPAAYLDRVQGMLRFLASLMDVGGNLPMIGDGDDGRVLRLSREPDFCTYRSTLATGALLLDDPSLARKAGLLDDQTRQLVSTEAWECLIGERADRSNELPRTSFPNGGYFILGSDFESPSEIRLIADAGPLGYLSIAAHGHADALAICLSVSGREFLIDPGTYCYHGRPDWRTYFRGTRAHNTVTIDGQDQSVQGGPFMWTRHARARCIEFTESEHQSYFIAEHDGYARLHDPVVHRREIIRSGRVIEIADTLECGGAHDFEQWWHFSEHCELAMDGTIVVAENRGVRVRLSFNSDTGRIYRYNGCETPIAGWVSRHYDIKTRSASICLGGAMCGTTKLRTVIEVVL